MKTKSFVRTLSGGAKTSFALGIALVLFSAAHRAQAASASILLEKGIYTEETKGDLQAAIGIYQQIVDEPDADRGLIAQAQLRLGLCELKLGNKPRAVSALDRLTLEFPDKDKLLAIVEEHMPQLLDEIVREIERNYIQEVDRGELIETAIRAIVGKLDSHGGFLRPNDMEFIGSNEMNQFNEQLEQKVVGIGAALKMNAGEVVVQSVLAGSPALAGGLRPGDRIVAINRADLPRNSQITTAVKLLRGPAGTSVTVGVKRSGSEDLHEINLIRDAIRLPTVLGERRKPDQSWDFMLDDQRKIGYIRLSYLGKQSALEMAAALDDLKARGMLALILDLRNSPGGLLDGAVAVSDLFLDSGRILTVKGRTGETVYDATRKTPVVTVPMALLVNRNTASAAEIIAACLQDHQRAVVIGERTFGQGIVRSLFQLKSGVGAVKLPVAAYYRPSGKSVNRYPDSKESDDWGVRPDPGYEVALTDQELKRYENDRAARDGLDDNELPRRGFEDRQLDKAVEYVLDHLK